MPDFNAGGMHCRRILLIHSKGGNAKQQVWETHAVERGFRCGIGKRPARFCRRRAAGAGPGLGARVRHLTLSISLVSSLGHVTFSRSVRMVRCVHFITHPHLQYAGVVLVG